MYPHVISLCAHERVDSCPYKEFCTLIAVVDTNWLGMFHLLHGDMSLGLPLLCVGRVSLVKEAVQCAQVRTLGEIHGDLLSLKSIHVPWKAMSDGCALIVHTLFYYPATAGCNALGALYTGWRLCTGVLVTRLPLYFKSKYV